MITRSNRNRKNEFNTLAAASRGFVVTALAAAVLSSNAYAQTNSSSGINHQSAQQAAQTPATVTPAKTTPARRATSAKKSATKTAKSQRARHSTATAIHPVKITIHGDRTDVRQARQQGMQSLQNANAAVADRNAAAAQTAADNAAAANDAALANSQTNYYAPYYGYGAGYLPPFINAGAPNGPYLPYGSVSTIAPITSGVTPFGSPVVNFPSYYDTYTPGVFSTYINPPFGVR